MEVFLLDKENIDRFEAMMGGANAVNVLYDGATFGLGLVHNNEIYGEIVVKLQDAEAVIKSLYIMPEHRREGAATALLLEASAYANMNENVDGFSVEFTENLEEDNGLKAFFEFCGFDLEIQEDITSYSMTVGDLAGNPYLKNCDTEALKSYSQLTHEERHELLKEDLHYMPLYVQNNLVEPDVSQFLIENGRMQGLIVVVPEEDALSIAWMRISPGDYKQLIPILCSAAKAAENKYEPTKRIILPIISKEANQLVNKLFGDKLIRIENAYTGTMMFEEDEYEE